MRNRNLTATFHCLHPFRNGPFFKALTLMQDGTHRLVGYEINSKLGFTIHYEYIGDTFWKDMRQQEQRA